MTGSGVTALIGDRLYPGQAPQDAQRPYAVYQQASQQRLRTMTGYTNLNRWSMRLDVYGATRRQAAEARQAITDRLDDWSGSAGGDGTISVCGTVFDDSDSDTEMPTHGEEKGEHRAGLDLGIWFNRAS
jgi:predicted heme/steroid binding protein